MNDAPGRVFASVTLSGTSASSAIDCTRYSLAALRTPAAITSTSLTFQASIDGTNFVTVRGVDGTAAFSASVAADQYIPLDPRVFAGAPYVKVVPGSSEGTPITLSVVLRPFN